MSHIVPPYFYVIKTDFPIECGLTISLWAVAVSVNNNFRPIAGVSLPFFNPAPEAA
jgi:hypothetical protein